MSADSKTQIVGTTGWAEQEREIERLNSLVSKNAADIMQWRNLFQNERDHMNAAQEEINRLTQNQRMQDSITAQVMERAEKAEAQLAHRNGEIVMAGLKVAELEAENEVFKSLYLNEQGRCDMLRVDAESGK